MGPGNVRWTSSPHGPALPLSRLGGHRFQGLLGGRCGSARSPSIPRPSASAGQSVVGAPAPDPPQASPQKSLCTQVPLGRAWASVPGKDPPLPVVAWDSAKAGPHSLLYGECSVGGPLSK